MTIAPSDNDTFTQLQRDDVQRRIIKIVGRLSGHSEDAIDPDTGLIFDLGITGDDADIVFLEILKTFPIDMSGIDFGARFGSEGVWPWEVPMIIWRAARRVAYKWRFGTIPRDDLAREVYIRDIIDAALAGRWVTLG